MKLPKRKSRRPGLSKERETIVKKVKMTENKGQFIVRIPRIVEDALGIKGGDKFMFIIENPPRSIVKGKTKLVFRILNGENGENREF